MEVPKIKAATKVKAEPKAKAAKAKGPAAGPAIQYVDVGRGFIVNPTAGQRVRIPAQVANQITASILAFDFHNVVDRYFQLVRGRAQKFELAYPSNRPALLPEIQQLLQRVSAECSRCGILFILLSRIGINSPDIESFAPAALRNSTEDSLRELFDLWIITRQRTGEQGKLGTLRKLFPHSCYCIIDDNLEILQEIRSSGHRGMHVRLPRRESAPGYRSYQNVFEAEGDALKTGRSEAQLWLQTSSSVRQLVAAPWSCHRL